MNFGVFDFALRQQSCNLKPPNFNLKVSAFSVLCSFRIADLVLDEAKSRGIRGHSEHFQQNIKPNMLTKTDLNLSVFAFTAGGDFHPALKTTFNFLIIIAPNAALSSYCSDFFSTPKISVLTTGIRLIISLANGSRSARTAAIII